MLTREEATAIAEKVVNLLAPVCEHIEVAGSVRRRKSLVKDLEIVCQPWFVPDKKLLFADAEKPVSAVTKLLERICRGPGPLRFDAQLPRNGEKYKRLDFDGLKIDLFMVTPPASWGALMVIRTGPADFSEAIVTKRSKGGAMPDSLSQREGALWDHRGDRLDTPDEESYFAALGLPCWDPADRSIHILRRHLGSQVGEESQLTAGQ